MPRRDQTSRAPTTAWRRNTPVRGSAHIRSAGDESSSHSAFGATASPSPAPKAGIRRERCASGRVAADSARPRARRRDAIQLRTVRTEGAVTKRASRTRWAWAAVQCGPPFRTSASTVSAISGFVSSIARRPRPGWSSSAATRSPRGSPATWRRHRATAGAETPASAPLARSASAHDAPPACSASERVSPPPGAAAPSRARPRSRRPRPKARGPVFRELGRTWELGPATRSRRPGGQETDRHVTQPPPASSAPAPGCARSPRPRPPCAG